MNAIDELWKKIEQSPFIEEGRLMITIRQNWSQRCCSHPRMLPDLGITNKYTIHSNKKVGGLF